ncbi:hypothetical protein M2272_002628 [Mycobacterium frederiksbergense]|uniref:Uncharacterized protein n=1 Tax=Mycolicibacterium frederiksbergense TaxID=117567 RepID=A0ABT6KZ62_9MYCO|nr:hypothetical protein [Mycolicibacterium frederiksbergense]MDH6195988.1 hypothetical protein [Mycolicibacterium frederiksbergense]
MTNVLTLPTALLDLTTRTTETVAPAGGLRADFQAELPIAASRFEFAVGVGAMLGGLVGLAVGAVVGGAALGIPVGIYSLVEFNNAVGKLAA